MRRWLAKEWASLRTLDTAFELVPVVVVGVFAVGVLVVVGALIRG